MFNYRQTEDSTFHRRSVYQNYILNALMLYQQKTVLRGLFGAGLVRTLFEYTQLYENRRDPKLTAEGRPTSKTLTATARAACAAL